MSLKRSLYFCALGRRRRVHDVRRRRTPRGRRRRARGSRAHVRVDGVDAPAGRRRPRRALAHLERVRADRPERRVEGRAAVLLAEQRPRSRSRRPGRRPRTSTPCRLEDRPALPRVLLPDRAAHARVLVLRAPAQRARAPPPDARAARARPTGARRPRPRVRGAQRQRDERACRARRARPSPPRLRGRRRRAGSPPPTRRRRTRLLVAPSLSTRCRRTRMIFGPLLASKPSRIWNHAPTEKRCAGAAARGPCRWSGTSSSVAGSGPRA